MNITWTAILDAELELHWREGKLSGRQIADVMKLPSKNCVIGRVHRLKLPKRVSSNVLRAKATAVSTKKIEGERRRQLRVRDARRKTKVITSNIIRNNLDARHRDPKLPVFPAIVTIGIPFLEIGPLQCHYVPGEPVANALMCGAPTDGGRYCAHHHARCFLPQDRRSVPNLHRQKDRTQVMLARLGE